MGMELRVKSVTRGNIVPGYTTLFDKKKEGEGEEKRLSNKRKVDWEWRVLECRIEKRRDRNVRGLFSSPSLIVKRIFAFFLSSFGSIERWKRVLPCLYLWSSSSFISLMIDDVFRLRSVFYQRYYSIFSWTEMFVIGMRNNHDDGHWSFFIC